ncbi:hypothetical protein SNEBB_002757 [Seison nebaliae]|nr:hypothetical protein SNEBB_002757 [Seison nebaliae]
MFHKTFLEKILEILLLVHISYQSKCIHGRFGERCEYEDVCVRRAGSSFCDFKNLGKCENVLLQNMFYAKLSTLAHLNDQEKELQITPSFQCRHTITFNGNVDSGVIYQINVSSLFDQTNFYRNFSQHSISPSSPSYVYERLRMHFQIRTAVSHAPQRYESILYWYEIPKRLNEQREAVPKWTLAYYREKGELYLLSIVDKKFGKYEVVPLTQFQLKNITSGNRNKIHQLHLATWYNVTIDVKLKRFLNYNNQPDTERYSGVHSIGLTLQNAYRKSDRININLVLPKPIISLTDTSLGFDNIYLAIGRHFERGEIKNYHNFAGCIRNFRIAAMHNENENFEEFIENGLTLMLPISNKALLPNHFNFNESFLEADVQDRDMLINFIYEPNHIDMNNLTCGISCIDWIDPDKKICHYGSCSVHHYPLYDGSSCSCAPGWTGYNCEDDIDECSINPPCVHGTCRNTLGSFYCNCSTGYTGRRCEIELDECDIYKPCYDEGSQHCIDQIQKFLCVCNADYLGTHCHIHRNNDTCDGDMDQCSSHGNCIYNYTLQDQSEFTLKQLKLFKQTNSLNQIIIRPTTPLFRCDCDDGYEGERCEIKIDFCQHNKCRNGYCQVIDNNYICRCDDGWNGRFCDKKIDYCEANKCKNNSTCQIDLSFVEKYKCNCASSYFSGRFCEIIDRCHNCTRNGGNCRSDKNDQFIQCVCPLDRFGDLCEEFDPCYQMSCGRHGRCVKENDNVRCLCDDGWTGEICEEFNYCFHSNETRCSNNGSCLNLINGYKCQCLSDYTGENCEYHHNSCKLKANRCLNNGRCILDSKLQTDTCVCDDNFQGTRCQYNVSSTIATTPIPFSAKQTTKTTSTTRKTSPPANFYTTSSIINLFSIVQTQKKPKTINSTKDLLQVDKNRSIFKDSDNEDGLVLTKEIFIIIIVVTAILLAIGIIIAVVYVVSKLRQSRANTGAYEPKETEKVFGIYSTQNNNSDQMRKFPEERLI